MMHDQMGQHGGSQHQMGSQPQMGMRTGMDAKMQECIRNCQNCHAVCLETINYCLQMGGRHAEPSHIRMLQDCANICATSADFMLRNSQFHSRTCGVCAEICELCAKDCDQFGSDQQMKACADMCRQCAASCREMAGMH